MDTALTLFFNGSQSLYLDGIAWTATQTSTWLPLALVLLYVVIRSNDLRGILFFVVGLSLSILLADQVASSVFKPLVARWRPSHNPDIMYLVDVVRGYRGGSYGFFSSHAANTMAVATFVSLVMRSKRLALWLGTWVLLNCWSRVYLGVHYVGDLLTGLLWGAMVGYAIFRLHRYISSKDLLSASAETTASALEKKTGTLEEASTTVVPLFHYSSRHQQLLCAALLATYFYVAFSALFFEG